MHCAMLYMSLHCAVLCSVYAEMLNRRQNRLQLVIFDVDCFVMNADCVEDCLMADANDSLSVPGSVWIVREETSIYWVNVSTRLPLFTHTYTTHHLPACVNTVASSLLTCLQFLLSASELASAVMHATFVCNGCNYTLPAICSYISQSRV